MINTYFHETQMLLHFEHENDVTIIINLLYSAVKFDYDCDIIFMFKMNRT